MQEIWKDVPNYVGLYQISNLGRVKSTPATRGYKEKILKNIPRNGYLSVILCNNKEQKNVFVHRLVAECFVPNPENKPIVNHIDGNKANPCAENLEWCTQQENIDHAINNGLFCLSKTSKRDNRFVYQFNTDGELIKIWKSVPEIASSTNYKKKTIYNCIYGERKTAYGYIWSKTPSYEEQLNKYKR